MKLRYEHLGEFAEILDEAFTLAGLDQMLLYRLGIKRESIALGSSLREIIFHVFTELQSRDKTSDLVLAARASKPDNARLVAFAQQLGLAASVLVRQGDVLVPAGDAIAVERKITEANSTFDVVGWRTRLGEIERQVCRVEISGGGGVTYGTAFLVGPDVVMTNYHVVERVIAGRVSPRNVRLRFDYKLLADDTTINSGSVFELAGDDGWLVDYSEYSAVDTSPDSGGAVPGADQLDYALLRLGKAAGKLPIGERAEMGAPPRGWVPFPGGEYDFAVGEPLYIMQHPEGEPLKLALDTDSVIGLNANRTRVRYRTNTERGSSGSPCFSKDWRLIALHHGGDPNFQPLHRPEYNQGIPASAVYELLKERGKDSELS